jgi:hypothetical protein
MLNKEISEVEKELFILENPNCPYCEIPLTKDGEGFKCNNIYCKQRKNYSNQNIDILECETKLSTLKSAQQKFDKFVEDLKTDSEIDGLDLEYRPHKKRFIERIDELSSKQEGMKE